VTLNEQKNIQAYNSWRNQLFLFDDVDIFFPLEIENKVVLPKIIRSVNRLKIFEIEHEIKSAKSSTHVKLDSKQIFFLKLPRWIRHAYYNYIVKRPIKRKMFFGTAYFSAAGTYTSELTWAIPLHLHTIGMYLCNVEKKQIVKENGFEEREILAFTITADHTIIDGADMARFIIKLKHNIKHLIHNL
jgi:pyruvate/2-oxoglutarate dehydrogenase complex dihydrolipoamide acyltransferase (E2) component